MIRAELPSCVATLALLALGLAASCTQAAEPTTDAALPEFSGEILLASYQASAYNQARSGALLWLAGPEGALRVEIGLNGGDRTSDPADRDRLLTRRGEGWTVVLDGADSGTLNAWGREWGPAPAGLGPALRRIGTVLFAGPEQDAAQSRTWRAGQGGVAVQREAVASLFEDSSELPAPRLRDRLTARGRGRGGLAEMLAWRWVAQTDQAGGALEIWSTGHPGSAKLWQDGRFRAFCADPETFVPLWPLAELIRPSGTNPN